MMGLTWCHGVRHGSDFLQNGRNLNLNDFNVRTIRRLFVIYIRKIGFKLRLFIVDNLIDSRVVQKKPINFETKFMF
jgi:hypothetical protein